MTIIGVSLAIGVLALVASLPASAEERFRPGKWEIVFTGDNPHTSTTCFTAAMTQGMNGTAEKTAAARRFTVEAYKFDTAPRFPTPSWALRGPL